MVGLAATDGCCAEAVWRLDLTAADGCCAVEVWVMAAVDESHSPDLKLWFSTVLFPKKK